MRQLVVIAMLTAVLLGACSSIEKHSLPYWQVAGQGEACHTGEIEEKDWSESSRSWFYLLIKTDDGQIGYTDVSAYQYVDLEVGDTVCVILP